MQRTLSIMVGAALAVTSAAPGFSPAKAASVAIPSPSAVSEAAPAGMLTNIRDGGNWNGGGGNSWRRYSRRGYGDRSYYRGGGYGYRNYGRRHFHDDDDNFGAGIALGVFGLAAGALIANQAYRYPSYGAPVYGTYGGYNGGYNGGYGGSDWGAACAQKYRSFDPRSGTYLGYDGYRHTCVLP